MLCIITCLERTIEDQTIGLLRSIKSHLRYDGEVAIFAMSPRAGFEPSFEAITETKRLGAEYVSRAINSKYADYPLANKPIVCDFIGREYEADQYLFLDSDTFFLNNTKIKMPNGVDAILRPVDGKNIGAKCFEDTEGTYWKKLYEFAGTDRRRYVSPSESTEDIFEYFNSGFIHLRNRDIFKRWMINFSQTIDSNTRPKAGLFFVEQSVFAATITAEAATVKMLAADLNYPIHFQARLTDDNRIDNVNTLRHVHYHRLYKDVIARRQTLLKNGFDLKVEEIVNFLDWPATTV